jgi:hypothetical protein
VRSASRPEHFPPIKRVPCTHWIREWVGSRAGLDDVDIPTVTSPSSSPYPVAIPTEPYRKYSVVTSSVSSRGATNAITPHVVSITLRGVYTVGVSRRLFVTHHCHRAKWLLPANSRQFRKNSLSQVHNTAIHGYGISFHS